MRRLGFPLLALVFAALVMASTAGAAQFGLSSFELGFESEGTAATQAGSHPDSMQINFKVNTEEVEGKPLPVEGIKDLNISQVVGLAGDQSAVTRCPALAFLTLRPGSDNVPECADGSAVGLATAEIGAKGGIAGLTGPVYFLQPSPGNVAKLGFWVVRVPVTIDIRVSESFPYNLVAVTPNVSQALEFFGAEVTLWGVPGEPVHDKERGACFEGKTSCPAGAVPRPLLTLPRACTGPLETKYELDSWIHPGQWLKDSIFTAQGMTGCAKVLFGPSVSVQPSSESAESASGLDVDIDVTNEGLKNPKGIAQADIEKIVTRLPTGITANPSAANGLGVCTKAQYDLESLGVSSCPDAAKLGSVEVETPLLEGHPVHGALYLASQDDNPFGSLLAFYLVVRDPELGIFIKQAGEVETDPSSGRLVSTFEELPAFPLSHVNVHLRSGPRAPLITPSTCGTYVTEMELTPSTGAVPRKTTSSFNITSGVNGGPCPAGAPSFAPGFEAGSTNNAASAFSPFTMRLTRADGEQDLTRFSAILPPGVVPRLAGVAKCSDAQIAAAENKSRTGREELASPSCPASSQVGHVLAGAGVGTALTYVPGSLYLAGPYKGDPLSVVAIVPAVAGPFDVGTIVTRVALNLNPVTYRGEVDGSKSDPIPHILKGIPVKVRDIRVYADRPQFTLNSTSCDPTATAAQIFGSGADVFNPADDVPVGKESRYQAASCASLGFKPKLSLNLQGGIKRDKNPALSSTITYPYPSGPGYANIGKAVVTLPPSEFIDPEHINNPCTRVQFNANECPSSSILGTAKAISPLLDEPLEGRVIFRSNGGERKLPDVVVDLHGLVNITLVGAVDTATPKSSPRIRTTFSSVPDAPVTSFTLNLYGGKRGLLVNNRNLCKHKLKAKAALTGQNGHAYNTEPVVKVASCKGGKAAKKSALRR